MVLLLGTGISNLSLPFGSTEAEDHHSSSTEFRTTSFAEIFPIRGAEDTLEDGEKMNLNIYGAPAPVYVRGMWSDGFRFETGWNHPDWPGWISFDLEKTNAGSMQLRIHGYVPDASAGSLPGLFIFRKRVYRGIARHTWGPLADNLRDYLGN